MPTLNDKRKCCKCNKDIDFLEYMSVGMESGTITLLGILLYKEIWINEIFIIKCCFCFEVDRLYGEVIGEIINELKK